MRSFISAFFILHFFFFSALSYVASEKAAEKECSSYDAIYSPHHNAMDNDTLTLTIHKNPDFVAPSGTKAFFVVKAFNHSRINNVEFAIPYGCFMSGICTVEYGAEGGGFKYVSAFDTNLYFHKILSNDTAPSYLFFPGSGHALYRMDWQKSAIINWITKKPITDRQKVSFPSMWKFSHCLINKEGVV